MVKIDKIALLASFFFFFFFFFFSNSSILGNLKSIVVLVQHGRYDNNIIQAENKPRKSRLREKHQIQRFKDSKFNLHSIQNIQDYDRNI